MDSELKLLVVDPERISAVVGVFELCTVATDGLVVEAESAGVRSSPAGELCSGSGIAQADTNSIRPRKTKRKAQFPQSQSGVYLLVVFVGDYIDFQQRIRNQ